MATVDLSQKFEICHDYDEAWQQFLQNGFCVTRLPQTFENTLDDLLEMCKSIDETWTSDTGSLDRATRSDCEADKHLRYSMNSLTDRSRREWIQFDESVGEYLSPLIRNLFSGGYYVARRGGDTCKAGCRSGQGLHSDGSKTRPAYKDAWMPSWIVMSIAVHDVDRLNAPMRIVTREQMMQHSYEAPPQGDDVPQQWLEQKVVMQKGDVLLRDPRVWHSGTPNFTDRDRFLPGQVLRWDGTCCA